MGEHLFEYNNPEDQAMFDMYVLTFQQVHMMYVAAIKAGFTKEEAMNLLGTGLTAIMGGRKDGSGESA